MNLQIHFQGNIIFFCGVKTKSNLKHMYLHMPFFIYLIGAVPQRVSGRCVDELRGDSSPPAPSECIFISQRTSNPVIPTPIYRRSRSQFWRVPPARGRPWQGTFFKFSQLRDDLHLWTNTLYKNYCNCYIKYQ